MANEEGSFEVGISRHAPKVEKKGETVDVSKQEVDMESAQEEARERAQYILENLEHSPTGAIMALEPSNVKRAGQTRDIFVGQLKELVDNREDIEIVELGEDKEKAEELLERIRQNSGKKFIISDLRQTWLIGFKETEPMLTAVNKWKNKLNGDEHLLGKMWASHQNEISTLIDELKQKGINVAESEVNPAEFKQMPEDQVIRIVTWMKAMKGIGELHFPNRPLILEGVSHNLRADYTSLALLGENISLESINRVMGGKFREPFERSSVTFLKDGRVEVKFKNIVKQYSPEEFDQILENVKKQKKERGEEWQQHE